MSLYSGMLKDSEIYAPGASYHESDRYTLLRNPHIARNEEVLVEPLKDEGIRFCQSMFFKLNV